MRIRTPSAAQLGVVRVKDSDSFEAAGEFRLIKVGIPARARETSDVDKSTDPMRKKNLVEFVSRSRGVTYCPDALSLIRELSFHPASDISLLRLYMRRLRGSVNVRGIRARLNVHS